MSQRRFRFAVVGNAVVDLYLHGLAGGWPREGERAVVDRVESHAAGNGLNVAVNLAGLGGFDVALVTGVGRDEHGALVRRAAEEAGVRLVVPAAGEGEPTAFSLIRLEGGSPSFVHLPGAGRLVTAAFLREQAGELVKCDALVLTALGLMPGLGLGELAEWLRQVRAVRPDLLIVADPVLVSGGTELGGLEALLAEVDYFAPNEAEAAAWSGQADADEARAWLAARARQGVVIKRGSAGVLVRMREGREWVQPAMSVEADRVHDCTGAGDAWLAGFVHGLLREGDVARAARAGNAAAAISIQHVGSSGFLPRYEELRI